MTAEQLAQVLLRAWEYRYGGWEDIVKTALIELGMEDEL
jgi:hypothetical protein